MREGLESLSDKEKQALRLLLQGHDAKSIAQVLGLSPHTVNERLRDARAKLGVTSSREAARLLAEAEAPENLGGKDNSVADKQLGDAPGATDDATRSSPAKRTGLPFVWLSGGMLIMSLIIAAAVLSSSVLAPHMTPTPTSNAQAVGTVVAESSGSRVARDWLALVDGQRWNDSWAASGAIAKAKVTAAQWAAALQPVRQPLGPVTSRVLLGEAKASNLQGAPAGEYDTLRFQTSFANMQGATETVIMVRQSGGWKVIGYFIR